MEQVQEKPSITVDSPDAVEVAQESMDFPEYPMGALRAWLTVLGASILQMCATGPITAFGVFQDFYTTTWLKHYSTSEISWIGSVELFIELAVGFVGGKLYDAGYCRSTLITGSILFTFSFFMLSLSKEEQFYQPFLSQGLGMGLGLSLIYIPTCTLVSNHFKSRKALAMGILVATGPLGGIIFSIMLNQLIHSNIGFQWGVRVAAFVAAGCFLIGNVLISVPPRVQSISENNGGGNRPLREWPYILTVLSGFVSELGIFFPVFYVQLFARQHNISEELSFYSLSILNIACIFGRIIPNYFADKYGAINVFILCTACNGLVTLAMLGAGSVVGLVLFCIFDGFFIGATIALYLPVVASFAPRESDMGRTMGLAIAPLGVASLIGPPIAGAVLGPSLTWWKGITFAAVCLTVSSVIELVARYLHLKKSPSSTRQIHASD